MVTLIENNLKFGYKIYRSDVVLQKHKEMIERLNVCHDIIIDMFKGNDLSSTWLYNKYNIFSAVGPCVNFYELFLDLNSIFKENFPKQKHLWFQSWLNYHEQHEVLDWHNHHWFAHGYVCLDPKKTKTVYEDYEIINELGNIYIGPCFRKHKVEVIEPFEGKRVTLGFDVTNRIDIPTDMISFIPVI